MLYVREKKTVVDGYMEVDIFARDTAQDAPQKKGTRSKRVRETAPAQGNLNDKNARRYLTQLANGNFGENDLFVTLTYTDEYLPKTVDEAEKHVTKFLRRVKDKRKKLGLDPLKYILVTEYNEDEDGHLTTRIHHHLLMNGMDRDTLEGLWRERMLVNGKTGMHKLGLVSTKRIDPDFDKLRNGVEGLAMYMIKNPKGKKRWSSSRNLKRPVSRNNDHKYSRKRLRENAFDPAAGFIFFEKQYSGWKITAPIEYEKNPVTGEWSALLRLWRRKDAA
ncbi:rolling circle replication-associated protein [Lacticaseibacillus sharpeae]|uniref:Replication-associated protein ORF2/G2P domain-containing protein n=1 Tax=Lacticaseibacillus sharpeae JCM 1186 = DSM 20505 TaxID=1291052 RepID=A0A0R1ZIB5_9LACO|nr:hypothetical protein [Lacticaseibacillus sharpeae]KRM54605.1 hypothetical protein FC18_GL002313 [Lacticaseibacillus sharpeae JCM 1186 = DSM 20505]